MSKNSACKKVTRKGQRVMLHKMVVKKDKAGNTFECCDICGALFVQM